jgi:hypothetical protein
MKRQKGLICMVESTPDILFALNFLVNAIFVTIIRKYLNFISYLYIKNFLLKSGDRTWL